MINTMYNCDSVKQKIASLRPGESFCYHIGDLRFDRSRCEMGPTGTLTKTPTGNALIIDMMASAVWRDDTLILTQERLGLMQFYYKAQKAALPHKNKWSTRPFGPDYCYREPDRKSNKARPGTW